MNTTDLLNITFTNITDLAKNTTDKNSNNGLNDDELFYIITLTILFPFSLLCVGFLIYICFICAVFFISLISNFFLCVWNCLFPHRKLPYFNAIELLYFYLLLLAKCSYSIYLLCCCKRQPILPVVVDDIETTQPQTEIEITYAEGNDYVLK